MKSLLFVTLLLTIFACTPKKGKEAPDHPLTIALEDTISFRPPKNIILMIGDGMGLTQITAAMYSNGNKLNLEEFKYVGLIKCYSSNDLITDSAAGATAFASGVKTYNGAIGVDTEAKPVRTILEEAKDAGLSAGLVVTSSITHATPACFYAHQKDRGMMEEIAADLVRSDVDFFVGGGLKYFIRRADERNLLSEMANKGFVIANFIDQEFDNIAIDFSKKFGYFTANGEPLPRSQGRDYFVQACQSAVTYLSSRQGKGFFLMIESSQIDWGGHANDSNYIISEMIEFDEAIGKMLEFAKEDGETLIIVTADHETGGYAINPGSTIDSIIPAFTTDQHTGTLVPVFAFGPGAELFGGIYENTSIHRKMKRAFGFLKI